MKIYKIKDFDKWAKKAKLGDEILRDTADEIERGLIEADLGGHLYKKRVASSSRGKSGGFRILFVYKRSEKIIFIYGFGKNERANISYRDEVALKEHAKLLLAYSVSEVKRAIEAGELVEVKDEEA